MAEAVRYHDSTVRTRSNPTVATFSILRAMGQDSATDDDQAAVAAAKLVDADVDVVVHVFHEKVREYYLLERLWGDARSVDLGVE